MSLVRCPETNFRFGDFATELPIVRAHIKRAKWNQLEVVYVRGLQKRFDLPLFEGTAYAPAYAAFLRVVVNIRTFDVAEATLRGLWHLEKKLLQLLHADSTGSRT